MTEIYLLPEEWRYYRLFSQPLPEGRGSHADSQLESRLPQETEDEPYLRRSEQDGFLGISRAGEFVL